MSTSHEVDLSLKIEFLGDWHVGEGAGQRGFIDRLVRRDPRDQLPYVPAKTLTGIWRDACETVAASLDKVTSPTSPEEIVPSPDEATPPTWQAWVDVVFGSQPNQSKGPSTVPKPARLSVRRAHLPDNLRQHLQSDPALRSAVTFVKPGVKMDPSTGQALDDHLRFEEVVRGGATLRAQCTLDIRGWSQAQCDTAQALLWAGAKVVERLGGKRRRGMGRCCWKLDLKDDLLRHLEPAPATLPTGTPQTDLASAPPPRTRASFTRIPLQLSLTAPAVIPERTVGNVVFTLDHIPGSHVLGHVSRVLGGLLKRSLAGEVARGDLQVGHAYVEVDGQRGLPVPLSFQAHKEDGGFEAGKTVWNLLHEDVPPEKPIKGYRAGYVAEKSQTAQLPGFGHAERQRTTHSTITDEFQRPTTEDGGVYTYEALRAGTRFQSELRIREDLADALARVRTDWWRELDGEVQVGIAKKDDYGLAVLSADVPVQAAVQASVAPPSIVPPSQPFTVWLISDLLLRDEWLQPTVSLDDLCRALERQLGVGRDTITVHDGKAFVRTRRTEGWHVGWGLPRPSYVGLAAGSCLMFTCSEPVPVLGLRSLEERGLGERRAEGFGEIRIDATILTRTSAAPTSSHASAKVLAPTSMMLTTVARGDGAFEYARIVETAAWRSWLRRVVPSCVSDPTQRRALLGWEARKPPNSQLGGLRGAHDMRVGLTL